MRWCEDGKVTLIPPSLCLVFIYTHSFHSCTFFVWGCIIRKYLQFYYDVLPWIISHLSLIFGTKMNYQTWIINTLVPEKFVIYMKFYPGIRTLWVWRIYNVSPQVPPIPHSLSLYLSDPETCLKIQHCHMLCHKVVLCTITPVPDGIAISASSQNYDILHLNMLSFSVPCITLSAIMINIIKKLVKVLLYSVKSHLYIFQQWSYSMNHTLNMPVVMIRGSPIQSINGIQKSLLLFVNIWNRYGNLNHLSI